jgi:hypothetical protein
MSFALSRALEQHLCGSQAQMNASRYLGARNKRWKRPADIYIGTAKRNAQPRVASLAFGTIFATYRVGTRCQLGRTTRIDRETQFPKRSKVARFYGWTSVKIEASLDFGGQCHGEN